MVFIGYIDVEGDVNVVELISGNSFCEVLIDG